MKQELKSKRSREMILKSGLELFSNQGYRATSMKEVANSAGISIGRVYHHFQSKLEIFTTLLDQYWERLKNPDLKLNRLSTEAVFPDDFSEIVEAIREVVEENKASIMLIYIDVIEFKGEHIQRFYENMALRFKTAYGPRFAELEAQGRLNKGADLLFAVMLTFRFFFQYYLVETSFGVKDHFGFTSKEVTEKAKNLLLHGLLKQEA